MTSLQAKKELINLLNKALELEHAAYVQYLAMAETVSGLNSEPIIARLKEIAGDEKEHQEKFRNLIGNYLGGLPTMEHGKVQTATNLKRILEINLKDEKAAIDYYRTILKKVSEYKEYLGYCFLTLEHEIRHVIIDEEEHVAELSTLLGK